MSWLLELSLQLDNHLWEHCQSREADRFHHTKDFPSVPPSSAHLSDLTEVKPMQLGHTKLSIGELEARKKEGRCLYFGQSGHVRASCPMLQGKAKVCHGKGGP